MRIITVSVAIVFLFFFVFYPKNYNKILEDIKIKENKIDNANHFNNLNLEAKAVLVVDAVTGKTIFELNPQAQLPLASLTKIMTAVVAEEIKKKDISELVDAALVQSSNQAASALASINSDFIDLMNKKAQELGLNQTYFLNETGLDISGQMASAYGSANDVVKLMIYTLKTNPDLFEATTNNLAVNTNLHASTTTLLIASKTGLTDLAGGNLMVVFDAGFSHPVASVVLGSTEKGRFLDTKKLIEATFRYLTK